MRVLIPSSLPPAQTAIVLLLVEMDRKSKEEAVKKAKSDAERLHNEDLHQRHMESVEEMKRKQGEIEHVISRLEERMMMFDEQLMDIRQGQRRRWF